MCVCACARFNICINFIPTSIKLFKSIQDTWCRQVRRKRLHHWQHITSVNRAIFNVTVFLDGLTSSSAAVWTCVSAPGKRSLVIQYSNPLLIKVSHFSTNLQTSNWVVLGRFQRESFLMMLHDSFNIWGQSPNKCPKKRITMVWKHWIESHYHCATFKHQAPD